VTSWENLAFGINLPAGANIVVSDLTPEPMQNNLVGTATLVRSIMAFNHMLPGQDLAVITVAVGITVMTNDAFFALASPDPLSDFQQDWYYWHLHDSMRVSGPTENSNRWNADIRSARRLRGGFKLVMVVETNAVGNPDTTDLSVVMRNLWQVTS